MKHRHSLWVAAAGLLLAGIARSAPEIDPLALESAPPAEAAERSALRLAVEGGLGRIDQRFGLGDRNGSRLSIDLRYDKRLSDSWRVAFSNRFDSLHPALPGQRVSTNSLREAYAGWQGEGGATSVDFGRINQRVGPAYGYNPTDYFRSGALRSITTADPIALRERRMGTVMVRVGQLWDDGGVSLALAPKLDDGPDTRTASFDLGATNHDDRAVLTATQKLSDRFSGQASVLLQRRGSTQFGLSMTALATDALVAYAELSAGRMPRLIDEVRGGPLDRTWRQKAAIGATYTFPGALSVTLEADYNGAGLTRSESAALAALGLPGYLRYVALTQPSQELGSRHAWLLFATKKDVGIKQLDLSALVRSNTVDDSGLVWAELRYHWPRFDGVLQWQRSYGSRGSEFGSSPYRQVLQVLGVFYL